LSSIQKCPNCFAEIKKNSNVCEYCDYKVEPSSELETNTVYDFIFELKKLKMKKKFSFKEVISDFINLKNKYSNMLKYSLIFYSILSIIIFLAFGVGSLASLLSISFIILVISLAFIPYYQLQQKQKLIKSFIENYKLSNSKQEFNSFLSYAIPKAKSIGFLKTQSLTLTRKMNIQEIREHNEMVQIWKEKCEQIIIKFRLIYKNDKEMKNLIESYSKEIKLQEFNS
tara:strand:- start:191 stop:871 length:681 start_codon:yes stop_codon:yes gene_type:complete